MPTVNPRVFLDLTIGGEPLGRVIFELFKDSAPKSTENFRALCTGEKGISHLSHVPLYYKNSIIHRSIPNFMIQGGDFTKRTGTGGESIYSAPFADEEPALSTISFDAPGLLAMANKGPNSNQSQFFVTLAPCPHLNGKHTIFGRVIKGLEEVVKKIAEVPTDEKDRPNVPVAIVNCGELQLVRRMQPPQTTKAPIALRSLSASSESESESSPEGHEGRRKRRRRHVRSRSSSPLRSRTRSHSYSRSRSRPRPHSGSRSRSRSRSRSLSHYLPRSRLRSRSPLTPRSPSRSSRSRSRPRSRNRSRSRPASVPSEDSEARERNRRKEKEHRRLRREERKQRKKEKKEKRKGKKEKEQEKMQNSRSKSDFHFQSASVARSAADTNGSNGMQKTRMARELQETEEEYDARLEREEKERIDEAHRRELEMLQRRYEEERRRNRDGAKEGGGIRYKGRGRMKYIDPETRTRRHGGRY